MNTRLLNISKIKVGSSADYPVLTVRESYRRVGPDDQSRESYEEIVWDLECLAHPGEAVTVRGFNQTLRQTLARRGVNVVLTEIGSATTLLAAGSLPGFPMVEHTATPQMSYGGWQSFTLRVTDRRPIADENNLVEHRWTISTTTAPEGGVQTVRRGEVRLANGSDAAAWVGTNIFGPVITVANTNGLALTRRTEINSDSAWCSYEYTLANITSSGGIAGLTEASVDDRTTQETSGRGRRVISGYAAGPNAATFAANQKLATPPPNTVLVGQEGPTPPNTPNGRISFRYEYAVGAELDGFDGIHVLELDESVDLVAGGRPIVGGEFIGFPPALRRGPQQVFVYRQSSSIRYLGGDLDDHGLTALLDEDHLVGVRLISRRLEGPIRVVAIEREYIFEAEQDLSAVTPRTLEVLA